MKLPKWLMFFLIAGVIFTVSANSQQSHTADRESLLAYFNRLVVQIDTREILDYKTIYDETGTFPCGSVNIADNDVLIYLSHNRTANLNCTFIKKKSTGFRESQIDSTQINSKSELDVRMSIDSIPIFDWMNLNELSAKGLAGTVDSILNQSANTGRYWSLNCTLKQGQRLKIEGRDPETKNITEVLTIYRVSSIPKINGVTSQNEKASQVSFMQNRDFIQFSESESPYEKDHIITLDADATDILILPKSYKNFDEVFIEYSLVTANSKPEQWENAFGPAKPLIALNGLSPGNDYDLYLRYSNTPADFNHYRIKVDQYFWQTLAFRLTIAGILISSIFLVLLFWNRARQKRKLALLLQKQRLLAAEMKSIRSQLNPHFVFNAMGSIQNLINKKDLYNANMYLSLFSKLMRDVLTNSEKNFVSLTDELKTIESYLALEKLRFGFETAIHIEESLNPDNIEFPSMLLQPLLENNVKHGINAMKDTGRIELDISTDGVNLKLELSDNGKGFDAGKEQEGFGLKSVQDRIEMLNQILEGRKIEMRIHSESNSGTHIFLTFFNWI